MKGILKAPPSLRTLCLVTLILLTMSGMGNTSLLLRDTVLPHYPFSHSFSRTFTTQHDPTTIQRVLSQTKKYHRRQVTLTGVITQPELHLDDSKLYIDFVFRLQEGSHSLVVFGRHDRTQGPLPISLHQSVRVEGIFWETLERNGAQLTQVLEAKALFPYPSLIPDNT